MSDSRKVWLYTSLMAIIVFGSISATAFALPRPPYLKLDPDFTPVRAATTQAEDLSDEASAYIRVVQSKRDLTSGEFDRLLEIAAHEPLEGAGIMAMAALTTHIQTVQGPETAKRADEVIQLATTMLKTPNATDYRRLVAIYAFRDLRYDCGRDLVEPYLKAKNRRVADSAAKYFEKIDGIAPK